MDEDVVPFALPDIGDQEIAAVVDVLRSGWLTTGPKTAARGQEFAEHLGGGLEASPSTPPRRVSIWRSRHSASVLVTR